MKLLGEISRGAFGQVFHVKCSSTHKEYAMKVLSKSQVRPVIKLLISKFSYLLYLHLVIIFFVRCRSVYNEIYIHWVSSSCHFSISLFSFLFIFILFFFLRSVSTCLGGVATYATSLYAFFFFFAMFK